MAAQIKTCFERYEKKYRLTAEQQRAILQGMAPYMKKDAYGAYTICNIYYDTPDWRLIRTSLEKPVYKEKLRVRSYGVPGEDGRVFVELKKKYDSVVYKRRVTMRADEAVPFLAGQLPDGSFGQIGQEIRWFQQRYRTQPGVFIAYDRLAFAGIDEPDQPALAGYGAGSPAGRPWSAHHRPRYDADGDQIPRHLSAVAQPPAVPGEGVPHLVLQVWSLLPQPHFTQYPEGGTYLCLTRSLERT